MKKILLFFLLKMKTAGLNRKKSLGIDERMNSL